MKKPKSDFRKIFDNKDRNSTSCKFCENITCNKLDRYLKNYFPIKRKIPPMQALDMFYFISN